MTSVIKLENVSKKFGKFSALYNVNFELFKNESVIILGPSGSGKSTLLRCICQLENISSGKIFVDGQQINSSNKKELLSKVSIVFQHFNLFSHFTVLQNLIYAAQIVLNMSTQDAITKADELLLSFGLKNKKNDMPAKLSGGQKQRVAICRALMMSPEVMLFDEPTSALDPESIIEVVNTITKLKHSMSVVIVTHNIAFAKVIADRIIFMDKGHILACQSVLDFFNEPKSHRARLFLENLHNFY
ncbi:arginine transport ATP-binding protein ArtM [Orientia chuto str. Dubai]|uniref:Arginine transport ATP-binding protein ArtM n=1 Tax=Orientia chuto str. Dubai TaxID=1359168 RepID=A0A0F3MP41_9RICK|nr:amino acid ABC transporter ATP-binding protein [Candidatus Orientia mediorientalis]KJV56364.1 arginine transport ATP-binding protein ArtM [Orientia chuto str. Dubai]